MEERESFFEKVYCVVRQIPEGSVTSYGAIAQYLGAPRAARMVGWALNAVHQNEEIPAHRVVNRKGLLTGKHHFGYNPMKELLEREGIRIVDDAVQDFEYHFWSPEKHL